MSKKRPTRSIYLPPALKQRQAIQKACGRQSVRDKQQNDDILEKFKKFQIDDMTSKERYVDIYANHTSHEHLLKDTKQIITYRSAILGNRHLFRDKIVLDVNCGFGLLSMFAIKAGAKHVYAIDASHSAQLAKRNVKKNKLSKMITVIQGEVNEIQLPVKKVDVIITLFRAQLHEYEHSLVGIVKARDKWLRPGGLMFPDEISLHIIGLKDNSYTGNLNFWNTVYDFTMTSIAKAIMKQPFLVQPKSDKVFTESCKLKSLDLYTVKVEDFISYDTVFRLRTIRSGYVKVLSVYFVIDFTKCHIPITVSTAPDAPKTCWYSTGFLLPSHVTMDETTELYGVFRVVNNATVLQNATFVIDLCVQQPTTIFRDRCCYST